MGSLMLPINDNHSQFIVNETTFSSASTQIYIELLGLNVTQKLIESKGGKLSISLSSENAVFNFPYSLVKAANMTDEKSFIAQPDDISKEKMASQAPILLENANVLLVEDNLINQKIVVLSLKKMVKTIDTCLLYTSDAADDMQCVDLGGRRIIKKKKKGKKEKVKDELTKRPTQYEWRAGTYKSQNTNKAAVHVGCR
eukprot:TRINITY_DN13934_c0_g1_i1.p1 TRINITY_DN13934_c0_g1~~TRINITY_DN13934_c0_g1_i1.p1  ORF type:complete len:198 (-),score=30.69 TRINITY_DN13934_c0_g1_i1:3-596(-)